MQGVIPYYGASGIVDYVNQYIFDENLILLGEDGENILSRNCRLAFQVSGKTWVNNHAHVMRPKPEMNIGYLTELLESLNYSQYNTGTAQPKLNKQVCSNIPIVCPSFPEQCAIAATLYDSDALLSSLDRLLAKKRDIKQAVMQQLLTGKQRLPGFSGNWEVKRLGDVLKVRHGRSQQGIVANNGKHPILATGGEIGRTNQFLYDRPSVLIGRKGTIDAPQYADTPFWTIDTLFYTEIASSADPKFIFYKFNMIDWRSYNEASGVPSLNASTIEKIEITCPEHVEQTAIAAVLTDMDAETDALTQRRDKTRAIKNGMMQELLTGRTRLV